MRSLFKSNFPRESLACGILFALTIGSSAAETKLLNASYDVTREFYQEFNPLFAAYWKEKTGDTVIINQSHGGSSKQARAVIDGLEADVLTMNQSLDIDMVHERAGLLPADWAERLPNHSVPFSSTIVFLVRKGNPAGIKDWDDLVRPGVSLIIPNPKTSGNGRYSYLAAWGYALEKWGGDHAKARDFVSRLFANVPILDTGGRGATTSFVQRGIGDVLLTFENEAALALKESGGNKLEVIVPSLSVSAENPVVWVDKVVAKHGTEQIARAYLEYLYSSPAQELAARHNFRPQNPAIFAKHADHFQQLKLLSVDQIAGGWHKAQEAHFAEGALFDQIYQPRK